MAKSRKLIQKEYRQRKAEAQGLSLRSKGRPRKDSSKVKGTVQRSQEYRERQKAEKIQSALVIIQQKFTQNDDGTDARDYEVPAGT